ncbi:MAG: hypothetical protein KDB00_16610 [Planctomycetales bacterium]|nr:hypothetical protein [Planctomycetales bacterium]
MKNSPFEISVLSSCSDRKLRSLLVELLTVSRISMVDIYLLRRVDLDAFGHKATALEFLKQDSNVGAAVDWLLKQFAEAEGIAAKNGIDADRIMVPALATFLPEIAWSDKAAAEDAITGLVNAVRIGHRLREEHRMEFPIVEMVCGTTVEHRRRALLEGEYVGATDHWDKRWKEAIIEYPADSKRELILDRLRLVRRRLFDAGIHDWALALELEPGSYVLDDESAVRHMFEDLLTRSKYKILRKHVGLNFDIAHMKIAGVSDSAIEDFRRWMIHSHVCDHPGMHTRDQVLGTWDPVDRSNAGFYGPLKSFTEAPDVAGREGLPWSRSVAIELEGCNRIMWIHDSVSALRHMQRALSKPKRDTDDSEWLLDTPHEGVDAPKTDPVIDRKNRRPLED